eukprot:CAMPEP_0113631156 /NCGR_PEP_ID=MMETSP0017_2-20120614/16191_1 /TAXON_ID=2856 /ORGANISM="Cylindrotheca closterium" /LENGTH=170 /DNA_ID=CAMNT_0000541655 /DNA_START=111 /DNA_END=623 /DNA_ORIENTATION=- /assembly_acc=CAM_ASM_000147
MTNGSQSPLEALTQQIGGESAFNYLIKTFSETILQDLALEVALKGMDIEALAEHMSNLIKMVFAYSCKSSMVNSSIRGQIVLRNYALFELGLSRGHLRKLQLHFEAAMRDSMVEGEVFDSCKQRFTDLCIVFEAEKRGLLQTKPSSMENDPAMIMMRAASSRRLVAPKAA